VTLKLGLLLVMVLALGACREDPSAGESSAMKYQRTLDASGKRVLVTDANGDTVAKLRKRNTKFKVYDESLAPVGFVEWQKAEGEGGARVTMRSLDGKTRESVEPVSEDSFEIEGRVRIERTDRGWAVFDKDAALVGIFERGSDEEWVLRPDYEGEPFEATRDGVDWKVKQGEETVLKARANALARPEILALKLDGLSVLERMSVGAWMERGRP
jgi:hypothetical protein